MSSHIADRDVARLDRYDGELRVTADIDDARPFGVIRAWSVFEDAGAYDIQARVSAGGDGFHVRGFMDCDTSDAAVDVIRREAGDDPRRVDWDATHHSKPTQILFTAKPSGEAEPWRSEPWRAVDDLLRRSSRFDALAYRVDGEWFG